MSSRGANVILSRASRIKQKLQSALEASVLEVEDVSYKHAGHAESFSPDCMPCLSWPKLHKNLGEVKRVSKASLLQVLDVMVEVNVCGDRRRVVQYAISSESNSTVKIIWDTKMDFDVIPYVEMVAHHLIWQ
ncbi:hypothetical protein NE237_019640 [Protea cynaroides]|uniref:Uncharacterized protein n=1 Tax=Protea cynaroides TaxID=273540 RepID=A0A9Q0H5P9_9MAGN|nr:hypothetical protein NE237_019640 [Protea cynaroides]